MDRIRFIPDRLFLTDEAANKMTTTPHFRRRVAVEGKSKPEGLILSLGLDCYAFLRIICYRLDSGEWRVSCTDANLPAHLYGHNGRPIRNDEELALALTSVHYFTSLVTRPEGHGRIIPGVGPDNHGYIRTVECMVQIQDPDHCLLIGSHLAGMRYQHGRPMITWGKSTTFTGQELGFTFYDKLAQRPSGIRDPECIDATRLECIVKNDKRLAKEVKASRAFVGAPGEVVNTLSLRTAYAVLRQNLGRMSGFGRIVRELPAKLSSTSKLLLMGLGARLDDPHALDLVLENYRRSQSPCERTFRTVNAEVREHAHNFMAPDALALVPPDFEDLQWSDVRMPQDERNYGILLRDLGAPSVPDPLILEAWSRTSFLRTKPAGGDLSGPYVPALYMPWRDTL